ncbi:insulinase family protein [Ruminococcaceae bacterium OttesenSCG-928-N02]|nr:insulinase family protein [Ruminococcaceae bacterium OttesenSCG-928-N02]
MKRELISHPKTGQTYHKITTPGGLTILCWPLEGYKAVHAVYGTGYGSVDTSFTLNGVRHDSPAGIAHFLEHKMFENENGQDAFELYAATGAAGNAFTSFDKTCYIFTATDKIDEALDILISFVSKPYFTDETVAKEQGIIGQEIKMYDDQHAWRMLFTLLGAMYFNSPVKEDIAGTVQSIAQITPEMLYTCTDAFYNQYNMVLSVAGGITPEQVVAAVERAAIPQKQAPVVQRILPQEPHEIKQRETVFHMFVSQPVLGLAYKIDPPAPEARLQAEMVAEMLAELIVGDTTPLYRALYDEGFIGPGFGAEVLSGQGYFSIIFSGEVNEPHEVRARITAEITRLQREGISEELFTACKNRFWGEAVSEMESVDDLATGLASAQMRGLNYFEGIDVIASITLGQVNDALRTWLVDEQMVSVFILPQEGE